MIITHHINEEEYEEAIQKIEFVKADRMKSIIYRYAHILMKEKPRKKMLITATPFTNFFLELFIQFLRRKKDKNCFEPGKLVGSFMNVPDDKKQIAIQFIVSKSKALGNY